MKKIRKNQDEGNIDCCIFVDGQKVFDTLEDDIILSKFQLYGVGGLANEWLNSYLSNRKQYVSIKGYDSDLAVVQFGVRQGSVHGPPLFLININNVNQAIKFY